MPSGPIGNDLDQCVAQEAGGKFAQMSWRIVPLGGDLK
jgi:hypothetical protein